MKQGFRRVLTLLLAAVFVFSAWHFIRGMLEYRRGEQLYETARSFTVEAAPASPSASEAPRERVIDFESLQKQNAEIFGWITIEDTVIDYPLLRGENNSYYLTHAYDHQPSSFGSIFMDCGNSADLSDRHTILYGHNMKNKAMFGSLSDYKKKDFAAAHDTVKIYLPDKILTYRIFSAYTAHVLDEVYTLRFDSDAAFQAMLDEMQTSGALAADAAPTVTDRILTLSTCTPAGDVNHRFVVNAVLVEEETIGAK